MNVIHFFFSLKRERVFDRWYSYTCTRCCNLSHFFYLLSWTDSDKFNHICPVVSNKVDLSQYKKLLFPGMFEGQDHWMLGVSSIKSRSLLTNKFTGSFWNLSMFSFLALPQFCWLRRSISYCSTLCAQWQIVKCFTMMK